MCLYNVQVCPGRKGLCAEGFVWLVTHSLTHIHSFIHSFIHSLTHSLTHSHTHTHTHTHTQHREHTHTHSYTLRTLMGRHTHSYIHTHTHSHSHSLSYTHTHTQWWCVRVCVCVCVRASGLAFPRRRRHEWAQGLWSNVPHLIPVARKKLVTILFVSLLIASLFVCVFESCSWAACLLRWVNMARCWVIGNVYVFTPEVYFGASPRLYSGVWVCCGNNGNAIRKFWNSLFLSM